MFGRFAWCDNPSWADQCAKWMVSVMVVPFSMPATSVEMSRRYGSRGPASGPSIPSSAVHLSWWWPVRGAPHGRSEVAITVRTVVPIDAAERREIAAESDAFGRFCDRVPRLENLRQPA